LSVKDALALYVDPAPGAHAGLESLLKQPFISDGWWITAVCGLYSLIVITGCDGWWFTIISRNRDNLKMVDEAIGVATDGIANAEWYLTHASELVWDDEISKCLKLIL
jgi:hypothetical protein